MFVFSSFFIQGNFVFSTILYNEKDRNRSLEYITCLLRNIQHPMIDKVIVYYEGKADDTNSYILNIIKRLPVEIEYISERPSFGFLFESLNQLYLDKKIILANADIYFDDSLNSLKDYDLSGKFIALTRYNEDKKGNINMWGTIEKPVIHSQDVWIYKAPIAIEADSIKIGTLTCDGQLAYAANKAGYKVINPYFSLKSIHLHRIMTKERLSRPYYYDRPTHIMMTVPWSYL